MVIVYFKGCFHKTFNSLPEAESYVEGRIETAFSPGDSDENNWSYSFY